MDRFSEMKLKNWLNEDEHFKKEEIINMNNLINFIYDLKDAVRTKQNNATLNSQDFILNNFENEINAIEKGDFFDYYSIIDNRLRLIRFDPVKMNINIEK